MLKQNISSAKNGRHFNSVKVRKANAKTHIVYRPAAAPQIANEVIRIIDECDPVGFLCDVVSGRAIECYVVDQDNNVKTMYETPTLKMRTEAAKYLTDKFMPKIAVVKHAMLKPTEEEDNSRYGAVINGAVAQSTSQDT